MTELFMKFVERMPDIIIFFDSDNIAEFFNARALEEIPQQVGVIGTSLHNIATELKWPEELIHSVLSNLKSSQKEYLLGTYQSDFFSKYEVKWKFYSIDGQLIIRGKDISKLIALKKETFMLSQVIEKAPAMIYWKDLKSKHLGCNEIFAKNAGLNNPGEIVGLTDFDLAWPTVAESYQNDDRDVISTGRMKLNIEDRMPTKNGELTVLTNKMPLRNENDNIIGVLGTATDITELKKIQEKLESALNAAKIAAKAKDAIVANMKHDWITPFSGIYSINDDLAKSEKDPERKEYLEMAAISSRQLLSHVRSIIEMVDAAEGKNPIMSEMINCYDILKNIYDMFHPEALRKNILLKLEVDRDSWQKDMLGDELRITKILMSIVSNAIKFSRNGDAVILRVSKDKARQNRHIVNFFVKDTGYGINPDNIKKIFEPFFKAKPSYNNANLFDSGPGVGLSIAKKYADDLKGQLNCKSHVEKGSVFVFSLPLGRTLISENELNRNLEA